MADLNHSEWEDILYEDEEIEDLIKSLKQLENSQSLNQLSELFQFNTPCGTHGNEEASESDQNRDCHFKCFKGKFNCFSAKVGDKQFKKIDLEGEESQMLNRFWKYHKEWICENKLEGSCKDCVGNNMIISSKTELESRELGQVYEYRIFERGDWKVLKWIWKCLKLVCLWSNWGLGEVSEVE